MTDPRNTTGAANLAAPENQNPLTGFIARYKNNRVAFVKEVLGVKEIEVWQEKALKLLDEGATRLSIRSGHGVGKTSFLAWVELHFIFTRYPCKVAVTAPSATQLFDALASETKLWLKRAIEIMPAFQDLFETSAERIYMKAQPEAVFVTYRTSRKESPEALQGIHADNVLLIGDEASGIPDVVFEAAAGSMSTKGAITVLAGNPTRATGFFFNTHTKLRHIWKSIKVSCFESTRVDTSYIEEERAYGENSNRWNIRVLGEFPEGDDDTLIPRSTVMSAVGRAVTASRNDPMYWGVDVARFGSDASTLAKRRGRVMPEKVKEWRGKNLMELCGIIVNEYEGTHDKDKPEAIFIDVIGLGAGVVDRLQELALPAVGINVSESPSFSMTKAMRLRDELWCHVRDWFATLMVSIPDDSETIEQIVEPRVAYTSSGKTKVESKDELRSRAVGSPDRADAFCLTFARSGAVGAGMMAGDKSKKGALRRKNTRTV